MRLRWGAPSRRAVVIGAAAVLLVAGLIAAPRSIAFATFAVLLLVAGAYLLWFVHPAWTLSGALVTSMFAGNWDVLGLPGTVSVDRVLLIAGIASVVVKAPPVRDRPPLTFRSVHWAMVVTLLWFVGSALAAGTLGDQGASFELAERVGLIPFLVFLVAPVAFATERHRRILLGSIVALGAYLGFTALMESLDIRQLVLPDYIDNASIGTHADRARGPFVAAVGNGLGLFCCMVASVLAARTFATRRWRRVAWAAALLCLAGIPVTYTRSVWIGALVAVVVTMALTARLRPWLIPAVGGAAVAHFMEVIVIPGFGHKLDTRYNDKGPVYVRENTNEAALNIIAASPVAGAGWNRFVPAFIDRFRIVGDAPPNAGVGEPAHNVYLSRGAELGLLGGGLWALGLLLGLGGALVRPVAAALRDWRPAVIAILTCWLVVGLLAPLDYTFPTLLVWVWAGILAVRAA